MRSLKNRDWKLTGSDDRWCSNNIGAQESHCRKDDDGWTHIVETFGLATIRQLQGYKCIEVRMKFKANTELVNW